MSRLTGGQIRRGLLMMVVIASILPMVRCGGDNGGGSSSAPPPGPGGGGGAAQFAYVVSAVDSDIRAYNLDGAGNLSAIGTPMATGVVPHHVNVDPQGQFVYVSNHNSTFVSGYRINQDGTLTPLDPRPGSPVAGSPVTGSDPSENQPHSSVMDQSRQFLYVVYGHNAPSTLRAYSIDASTGALTFISGQSFPVGNHAHNITISPNNQFLYVASEGSGDVHAFSRNTTTGALTSVGAVAGMVGASAVTVDPQNNFLYASYNNAVEVFDIGTNGALTRILPTSTFSTNSNGNGSGPHSIAMHPNGRSLYTANINPPHTVTVFRVDSNTGVLTEVIQSPLPATGADPNYVVIHPNGQFLYTADNVSDRVSRFTINADGTLVTPAIAAITAVDGANGIGTTKF